MLQAYTSWTVRRLAILVKSARPFDLQLKGRIGCIRIRDSQEMSIV